MTTTAETVPTIEERLERIEGHLQRLLSHKERVEAVLAGAGGMFATVAER